jgi:RNA polymerase sigma-70 factor (ECF subfamily)
MKKNWLARLEANTISNGARRLAASWARAFRQRPLVYDTAFQERDEPYPGHWRDFPDPWPPAGPADRDAVQVALRDLPDIWRRVLIGHDVLQKSDAHIAAELGLTLDQERDIVTEARAAVRERLDGMQASGDQL